MADGCPQLISSPERAGSSSGKLLTADQRSCFSSQKKETFPLFGRSACLQCCRPSRHTITDTRHSSAECRQSHLECLRVRSSCTEWLQAPCGGVRGVGCCWARKWCRMLGVVAMLQPPSCLRSHIAPGAARNSGPAVQPWRARWVRKLALLKLAQASVGLVLLWLRPLITFLSLTGHRQCPETAGSSPQPRSAADGGQGSGRQADWAGGPRIPQQPAWLAAQGDRLRLQYGRSI